MLNWVVDVGRKRRKVYIKFIFFFVWFFSPRLLLFCWVVWDLEPPGPIVLWISAILFYQEWLVHTSSRFLFNNGVKTTLRIFSSGEERNQVEWRNLHNFHAEVGITNISGFLRELRHHKRNEDVKGASSDSRECLPTDFFPSAKPANSLDAIFINSDVWKQFSSSTLKYVCMMLRWKWENSRMWAQGEITLKTTESKRNFSPGNGFLFIFVFLPCFRFFEYFEGPKLNSRFGVSFGHFSLSFSRLLSLENPRQSR